MQVMATLIFCCIACNEGKLRTQTQKGFEEGKEGAGLNHIKLRHSKNFNNKGIEDKMIPEVIREAILHGKIIGKQGKSKTPGDIYEVDFIGKKYKIMIVISGNGFIITAHTKSL